MEILDLADMASEIENIYKKASIKDIDKLSFYDDVKSALSKLEALDYKLGIVTSKDEYRTNLILDKLGVNFLTVQTLNSQYRGKPAPDHLLAALAITNTDPSEAIYIGDMEVDYIAASRAGIDYFHAIWGYSKGYGSNIIELKSIINIIDYLQ